MKRILSILVIFLLASAMSAAHVVAQAPQPYPQMPSGSGTPAEAKKQVEGTIKNVDPDGGVVTLEDGTRLMIPASVRVQRAALKEGATVKASFTENPAGQKIGTSIEVQ
ncbi:MAG: DUF1344 domain-containing protein [Candidatus Rokubacteria bacterium]|nr:DUF1344 domain-containing protein [Candidatus Rokubacteria bacterium]